MPLGLYNAPAKFERLMETTLDGLSSEACLVYLDDITIALTSSLVLTYPRTDKDFILDTDTSNEGIGAVLYQNIGNVERVIAYFSKSLGKPEINYCVTRKELLAIAKSIKHFYHYIYGRKFLLWTDHASLRWLLNFKEPEDQIARWIQRLQEYDFEIYHRKETSHGNADALARRSCKESCKLCTNTEKKFRMIADIYVKVLTTTTVDPWCLNEIQKAQLGDPAIKPILEKELNLADLLSWQEIATESPATKRYWALWDSLHLKDGVMNLVLKNQTDWDSHLPLLPMAYRSAEHEMTGLTPAKIIFGRTLRLPCDIIFGRPSETPSSPNEYMKNLETRLENVHAFARERIKLASERMKTRYDSRATDHHFKEDDLV
ncbi:Retrovirus-related Pol polyprotein from transposon 297 [Araneus ventricosus]|uniref:Retrovirus-related Pol polyprotein from transposon 297 n=1 Tax=Araneus ventricosus TaxID=182803 RepID=A0A4Y2SJJ3_ARAVE|nr:Retrovirus-related Pol polyprotein from transposon 297 [Araneus ventricosus]